jgi:DNA polymerase elongation subunit (family B)
VKHTAQQVQFQPILDPSQQYSSVVTIGNSVYARARGHAGEPVYCETKYLPTFYTPLDAIHASSATTHGYDGTPLMPVMHTSIHEGRTWMETCRVPVYGDIQHEYMMLSDVYKGREIAWDIDKLYIWNIDIEVDSEHGFAKPEDPFAEVTSITVMWRHLGKTGTVVYGCKDYTPVGDEFYVKCENEHELLLRFLDDLRAGGDYPDVITGWYINAYDIPYLTRRLQLLFTEETWSRISPFGRIKERQNQFYGRQYLVIELHGIQILDYIEMYRKFGNAQRENFRLDTIAHIELNERKLSYKEVGTLRKLYSTNYQKFIEYNIQDVRLVDRLDQKLKLLELVFALAYAAKSNFTDCFKQVRLWDVMIYHFLRSRNMQIPPRREVSKTSQYEGAYVKDPMVGMHHWVCSFDVASMYPHIIRQWNLSPEMKLPTKVRGLTVDKLLARQFDTSSIKQQDAALSANGVLTRRRKEGFLPEMLKTLYDERNRYKKLMKDAKKALEHETDENKKKELVKNVAAYNNQQQVRKVNLNSAYGAIGSNYFRFYDIDLAEAVTVTGQMVIRWVADDINRYLNAAFKTNEDYIIASDTDSVYVRMERVAGSIASAAATNNMDVSTAKMVDLMNAFCEKKIQPLINQTLADIADYLHVYLPCLSMVRDVIADKAVWTAKKRYIMNVHDSEGVRYEKPQLKVMGLESIKSSTPAIVRKMITETLRLCMQGRQDELWAFVEKSEREFKAASFEEIAFPRTCNGIEKYAHQEKSVPIHVAGALAFNRHLEKTGLTEHEPIREGEKINFVYLRQPNPFGSHVMAALQGCPDEWQVEQYIDYNAQWDKTFLQPVNVILTAAGWSTEEVATLW